MSVKCSSYLQYTSCMRMWPRRSTTSNSLCHDPGIADVLTGQQGAVRCTSCRAHCTAAVHLKMQNERRLRLPESRYEQQACLC